ncbi:MAG: hypothetical protein AB1401_00420 [Thermodesulfobacteriota bacterium]
MGGKTDDTDKSVEAAEKDEEEISIVIQIGIRRKDGGMAVSSALPLNVCQMYLDQAARMITTKIVAGEVANMLMRSERKQPLVAVPSRFGRIADM